ncbi:MAG: L,D-transpeptidase family protein [Planctomycetaceae bacterium]
MRRNSRRRTVTPFSISFVVLISATAAMAWYWKWIPWELSSRAVDPAADVAVGSREDSESDEPSSFTDEFGAELALSDSDDDDSIFTSQREPGDDDLENVGPARQANQDVLNAIEEENALSMSREGRARKFARAIDEHSDREQRPRRASRVAEDDLFNNSADSGVSQIAFEDEADDSQSTDDLPPLRTAKATKSKSSGLRSTNEKLAEIDNLIDAGDIMAAHEKLSEWYFAEPDMQPDLQERIDATAQMLFFSPQPHIEEPYVVQPGDQLRKVGRTYHVPWEFIARVNRIDPRKIRAGQKLKVFTGPFTADVDVSDFRLVLKWKDLYVKSYLVGVGTKGSTPLGEFAVKDKLVDPVYYGSEGDVIANDDPNNPLGERWIDLGDSYGIHGTIEPDSIGKAMSKGCIRMHNEEVEEVYDFLDIGSTVVIRP